MYFISTYFCRSQKYLYQVVLFVAEYQHCYKIDLQATKTWKIASQFFFGESEWVSHGYNKFFKLMLHGVASFLQLALLQTLTLTLKLQCCQGQLSWFPVVTITAAVHRLPWKPAKFWRDKDEKVKCFKQNLRERSPSFCRFLKINNRWNTKKWRQYLH